MRRFRLVTALAAVAVVAASFAGWRVLASPRVARAKAPAAVRAAPARREPPPRTELSPSAALQRSLQRVLAEYPPVPGHTPLPRTLRFVVPSPFQAPLPGGSSCYVGAGDCSETPCVEFARGSGGEVGSAANAAVLQTVMPALRGKPVRPTKSGCQGRLGTAKILRVSAP